MATLSIVEHFNVLKNRELRLLTGLIGVPAGSLAFERTEERFHCRVVIAVTLAAHANLDTNLSQQRLISPTRILTAAIGMMQSPSCWKSSQQDHLCQRLLDQVGITMGSHRPADDQTREQI